jgi:hypothetical protein
MFLVDQHVVVDVTDRQRAVAPDQPQHLAQIGRLHGRKPFMALALMAPHRGNKEAHIPGRHIGQGVGPVFEHAFVDALGLTQIGAPIFGDPSPENMVMAALDDVDGVDLHIAEMFNGGGGRLRALAERPRRVEPLGAEPDPPGLGPGQGMRFTRGGHRARM